MTNPWLKWWTDSVALVDQPTFPRLLLALILGACIGAERQWRQRAAGLRTNTLVCFGAAAFVDLGLTIAPGTTQVIAYVVSGVGFLGAGAIMKDGANVRGLNTAATLWCSAAVGACAGAGEMLDAVFVTVLLIAINSVLRPLSRAIDRRSLAMLETRTLYRIRLLCDHLHQIEGEYELTRAIALRTLVLRSIRAEEVEGSNASIVQAVVESSTHDPGVLKAIAADLQALPWVQSVEWTETAPETE
ncbi:MgtC/SapB family protein [Edaphobacter flagellatus]|uniref:MgtC/SapB family protein n=1 Tax=Edaphobacter flagellatus TaxID=1933044 RepID=UPI0021B2EE57|nr:MgtC/SapB family protein [Edaphobacter flagellatus]